MRGLLKILKDKNNKTIYPLTVAENVYISQDKTLKEGILDGTLGGQHSEINVNGRAQAIFMVRSYEIYVKKSFQNNNVSYSFPNLDSNRARRMYVFTPSAKLQSIDIPDGDLKENEALIYNLTTNTLSIKSGTWGNVPLSTNEYLLLYNNLGIVGGILQSYLTYGKDDEGLVVKEVQATKISETGSTQGIFIVDGTIYTCTHSNDEHTDFATLTTQGKTIKHNFGHMNAPDYSHEKDSLIVGNGSKSNTLPLKGWIFTNFKEKLIHDATLDMNSIEKVELDFTHITNEYKAQLCWGYGDSVFLMTNDNRTIRKINLAKGSERLTFGVFQEDKLENKFNGTYEIVGTWYSRTSDVMGGFLYHKGYLYTGIKGQYGIRKNILKSNGYFDSEYLPFSPLQGDMQGIGIHSDSFYAFTDYKGYSIKVSDI